MPQKSDKRAFFDFEKYGSLIRRKRLSMGYQTGKDFSRGIYLRTRFHISDQSLYKIEQGKQEPTLVQFLAINLALFQSPFPGETTYQGSISPCLLGGWEYIEKNEEISDEWKRENFAYALVELSQGISVPDGDIEKADESFKEQLTHIKNGNHGETLPSVSYDDLIFLDYNPDDVFIPRDDLNPDRNKTGIIATVEGIDIVL